MVAKSYHEGMGVASNIEEEGGVISSQTLHILIHLTLSRDSLTPSPSEKLGEQARERDEHGRACICSLRIHPSTSIFMLLPLLLEKMTQSCPYHNVTMAVPYTVDFSSKNSKESENL